MGRVRLSAWVGCSAAMLLCIAATARAQAPAGVSGRVTGPAGEPVAAAMVRLSTLDGADFRATRTAADGSYQLAFPTAGLRFSLWVERLGYAPATAVVDRGGTLVRNVRLVARPAQLAGIDAVATRTPVPRTNTGPGGRSNALQGDRSDRYPVEPGDLGAFAANTRGAVAAGGGEGVESVSLGGMAPSQNRTVMDGASSSAASLPAEAVRAVGVVANGYDVSRGQFTGGQLAVATMGGSNFPGGAFSARWRTPPLSWTSGAPSGAGWESGWAQVSGGYGGALKRDRLFAFAALQASRRSAPAASLADADAATLGRFGLSGDSVRRFADVLARVGAPVGRAPSGANSELASALVRLDWRPSETHSFVARLDGRGSRSEGIGSPLGWAGTGGRRGAADGGALLAWTARWAGDAQQELRAYVTAGQWRTRPYLDGPAGQVRVASAADGEATLEFGGAPYLSSTGHRSLVEISDDAQLPLAGGSQQLRFGAVYAQERTSSSGTSDGRGTFVFNSLDDLEAGTPSAFTRTLSSRAREAAARYLGAYVGHRVQAGPALSVGYGVRLDAGSFPASDAKGAESVLGYRPGRVPAYASLSPRFGFTYEVGKTATLLGGVGRFVGRVPLASLATALAEDGSEATRLVCLGPAAPVPDWDAYGRDPGAIPERCADGGAAFAQRAPSVAVFAPGFAPPHAWRGSLELSWNPGERWFADVQVSAARGGGVPLAFDRNLARVPGFALAAEGGRPVYAPATAVDAASGAVAPSASRLDPAYAAVREVTADGRSGAAQLTASLSRRWASGLSLGVWYTHTRAWDEASAAVAPGGGSGGTAGDPWAVERATADHARRHALSLNLTGGLGRGMTIGVIGRLLSGLPYTPWVDGDVNGDGVANDRAFVFAPDAATGVSGGMARLLAEAPAGAKGCLRRQLGNVAERNSCTGPWLARLDAQATLTPDPRSKRVRFTLLATNLAGAVDYVAHGASGLHGWGQARSPDPTLLYVRGFDPAALAFRYEVNPRFGRGIGALATPFMLTLQARVNVGADPARQWIAETLRSTRRYRRSSSEIAAALAERIPNYPAQALAAADSAGIGLTPLQRETLRGRADSTRVEIDALIALLAPAVSAADTSVAPASSPPVRELTAKTRALAEASLARVRAVLTPEQLNRLPARLLAPLGYAPIAPPKPIVMEMPDP